VGRILRDRMPDMVRQLATATQDLQRSRSNVPFLQEFEFDIAIIDFPVQTKLQLEQFSYKLGEIVVTESRNLYLQKQAKIQVRKQPQQGQQFVEPLGQGITLDMVMIPSGTFMMGAPESEKGSRYTERPQHKVSVGIFFIGKYPITQAQYEAVMGNNPSRFKDEPDSPNHPVENVLWEDAVEFCRRLSKRTGKEYRLPSEAEWEYACRSGTTTPFHFGETLDTQVANYDASSIYGRGKEGEYRQKTTPVGYFKFANSFGLFDMHGNVREWCADTWHSNYKGAPEDGSAWVELNKTSHLLRGGSWYNNPDNCRSAFRDYLNADLRSITFGFRVACLARGLL